MSAVSALDIFTIMKEYGLAGVMAWLFWWTLRRMITSHDATVSQLKAQLQSQGETARATGERFTSLVENHLTHSTEALERFQTSLGFHTEEQRRWQERLLKVLEAIHERLNRERSMR